jgi:carbamate kinase
MLVVVALGGNALLRRNEPPEAEVQRKNIIGAVVQSVAPIARKHDIVVTHRNGPQIGLLALQAAAFKEVRASCCFSVLRFTISAHEAYAI